MWDSWVLIFTSFLRHFLLFILRMSVQNITHEHQYVLWRFELLFVIRSEEKLSTTSLDVSVRFISEPKNDSYICRACSTKPENVLTYLLTYLFTYPVSQKRTFLPITSANVGRFSIFFSSRSSVAMRLRCDGIFNDCFIARLLLSVMVKEFWKSVNIWQSYGQE